MEVYVVKLSMEVYVTHDGLEMSQMVLKWAKWSGNDSLVGGNFFLGLGFGLSLLLIGG